LWQWDCYTQMIHNFADPSNPLSTINTEYNYLNTPWMGVRPSALRYVLEPRSGDDTLNYNDVNNNDHLSLCKWGTSTDATIA